MRGLTYLEKRIVDWFCCFVVLLFCGFVVLLIVFDSIAKTYN